MEVQYEARTDEHIMEQVGSRIRNLRLRSNFTQGEIATKTGLALKTIQNLENGKNPSLETIIRVLRAINAIQRIDEFLPDELPSPMQLLAMQGKERKRASGSRVKSPPAEPYGEWKW